MSILQSVLDSYPLPVQFTYRYRQPKRSSYMPTVDDGIIRGAKDLVPKDTLVNFDIRDEGDDAAESVLRGKYEASDNPSYTFVGHRDTANHSWYVKIEDFEAWYDAGLWQMRGILRIVSAYTP